MAQIKKPNTICRNPNCTNGTDGGRKHYYACMTCLRINQWKSYCCSMECYDEYTRIILADRAKTKEVQYPERTDMTVQEIKEVLKKPVEEVIEYTKTVELADYVAENPDDNITEIVNKVNEDIDAHSKRKRKNKV